MKSVTTPPDVFRFYDISCSFSSFIYSKSGAVNCFNINFGDMNSYSIIDREYDKNISKLAGIYIS